MNHFRVLFALMVLVIIAGPVGAEDLVSLDKKITAVESQISGLTKQYDKGKSDIEQQLARIEQAKAQGDAPGVDAQTKAAYAATEQLNRQLAQINELKETRKQLCETWRATYRKTVDDLLQSADQEKDKGKKAQIGKSLQKIQARNSQLCAESQQAALFQEWRALQVESYDGPQEIAQKLQLLQDISREVNIGLARMDQRYQEALREEKTRERAQEFVQEGTLFTEGMSVRPGTSTSNTSIGPGHATGTLPGGLDPASFVDHTGGPEGRSGIAEVLSENDWLANENPQQRDREYKKAREALLQEQKEIQQKIQGFEQRAKDLTLP